MWLSTNQRSEHFKRFGTLPKLRDNHFAGCGKKAPILLFGRLQTCLVERTQERRKQEDGDSNKMRFLWPYF